MFKKDRQKGSSAAFILVLIGFFTAVIIYVLITFNATAPDNDFVVFENETRDEPTEDETENPPPDEPPATSDNDSAEGAELISEETPGFSADAPDAEVASEQPPVASGIPVAKSDAVDNSYFDDAAFVGDSLTDGINYYSVMSNTTVISYTGIGPDGVWSRPVIEDDNGNMITMYDALLKANPRKIYIMLGSNGVEYYETRVFIGLYEHLVEKVKEDFPDSIIYLQSVLPVTKAFETKRPKINNAKIDEYNDMILDMAGRLGVHYVNVAECMKDEDGALFDEASSEGMHLSPTYYNKWFDYLKEHTVR